MPCKWSKQVLTEQKCNSPFSALVGVCYWLLPKAWKFRTQKRLNIQASIHKGVQLSTVSDVCISLPFYLSASTCYYFLLKKNFCKPLCKNGEHGIRLHTTNTYAHAPPPIPSCGWSCAWGTCMIMQDEQACSIYKIPRESWHIPNPAMPPRPLPVDWASGSHPFVPALGMTQKHKTLWKHGLCLSEEKMWQ